MRLAQRKRPAWLLSLLVSGDCLGDYVKNAPCEAHSQVGMQ